MKINEHGCRSAHYFYEAMKPQTILFLVAIPLIGLALAVEPATDTSNVKALFGAFGGIGTIPNNPPPGFESAFAVAVVEINSPIETSNVAVSDFVLLDQGGKAIKIKRVVEVEEFNRPRIPTEGIAAYYLNNGGTRLWNGTLPAGRIRLRIKVALREVPVFPFRIRLKIGQYIIEVPVNCGWPT